MWYVSESSAESNAHHVALEVVNFLRLIVVVPMVEVKLRTSCLEKPRSDRFKEAFDVDEEAGFTSDGETWPSSQYEAFKSKPWYSGEPENS